MKNNFLQNFEFHHFPAFCLYGFALIHKNSYKFSVLWKLNENLGGKRS